MIYPSLLQSANIINSNSWFDIQEHKNKNRYVYLNNHKYDYVKTKIIVLKLNDNQIEIINKWLDDVIDIYNLTNEYIKSKLDSEYKNFNEIVNFYSLRMLLKDPLKNICKINGLNKHTGDYGVKHCVEMYKSAFSNLKNKNIKHFEIKNLLKSRRRKNLVIEPNSVSKNKNSIFYKSLGLIESNLKLTDIIKRNSILQLDTLKKRYIIISPEEIIKKEIQLRQYKKVGIDIGVRSFITCYSPEKTYLIGNNTDEYIDRINKRLDNIKSNHDKNNPRLISDSKYNKVYSKYSEKLKNKIKDLHNKTAKFLLERFREITIGKVSIKSMTSKLTGNIRKITKRRLLALSHYKFRMKLHQMKNKYNVKINETNEYKTSITCSKCKYINKKTKSKTFSCKKCKLVIDRDINASINIYNEEY
jgi:transposase